jgi:ribonuclease P/MRP protein subunit RPP40
VWNPHLKKDIELSKRVQRRATKLVPQIRFLAFEKRLELLGLSTLSERRERGDLIQYFKIHNQLNVTEWIQPNQQMVLLERNSSNE